MIDQATRSAETRERILTAAAGEFERHGYAGASIGTIADKADVGKGLVQYHFRAKSDIARSLIQSVYGQEPFARAAGEPSLQGIDALVASIRAVAQAFRGDVRVRASLRLMREHARIDVELPMPYVGWISRIAAMLDEAGAMGEVRPGLDTEREAYHLVAHFYGVQDLSGRLTGHDDLAARVEEMMTRALSALGVADVQQRLAAAPGR